MFVGLYCEKGSKGLSMDRIEKLLFANQDLQYKEFNSSLMPTIEKESVIGVRVPILRKIASELLKDKEFVAFELNDFLCDLPHKYYEQNMLHSIWVSKQKCFDIAIEQTQRFLPYVDNWAVCDCFAPKCFEKNKQELWQYIDKWLDSDKTYTVRFAIVNAMRHFLDEDFSEAKLERVLSVRSEEYYINMALAWYMSTALAKRYDRAIEYLKNGYLSVWVHNKAIQKAIESYRVSDERKEHLKTLKIHE